SANQIRPHLAGRKCRDYGAPLRFRLEAGAEPSSRAARTGIPGVRIMFRGSLTALVTPFTRDGALDKDAFRSLVEWQIAEGTSGLVPVGTTGESPTLSHAEHREVV